jgi:hypothetical protein
VNGSNTIQYFTAQREREGCKAWMMWMMWMVSIDRVLCEEQEETRKKRE